MNGKNGYKVTSKENGEYIFLPAAGYCYGSSLYNAGFGGYYWSSAQEVYWDATSGTLNTLKAYGLSLERGSVLRSYHYRYLGLSIRPVSG